MASVQDISDRLRLALQGEGRQAFTDMGKTLKIDLKGEGIIFVSGAQVSHDDGPADCTVLVSRDDLAALAQGRLDPMTAMMRGRLKIQGDMAVAMKLQSMLRALD